MRETGMVGVVVLGAGRSGTSAITRALVAAGFYAGGEDELVGPAPSNPVGHYESLRVLAINEELLERFGCRGGATPSPQEQAPLRAELQPRLRSIVDWLVERAEGAPVVIKEPRVNGLMTLWQPAIEGTLHAVLAVRDPLEVAMSVSRRDGISVPHALAIWEAHTAQTLAWLDGRTATVSPYAGLAASPGLATEIVADAAAHLEPGRARRVRPAEAATALRPDLRREDAGRLSHADHLTGRQAEVWEYLRSLPAGDVRMEVPAAARETSAAAAAAAAKESERFELAEKYASLAADYREAMARLNEVERRFADAHRAGLEAARREERRARELERVEASLSWRATASLRRAARLLGRSA